MLVLSRRAKESIMIGDDIEVTIVEVQGDTVKLAISAPRHIPVHRREVFDEIRRENREASTVSLEGVAGARRALERKALEHGTKPSGPAGGEETGEEGKN